MTGSLLLLVMVGVLKNLEVFFLTVYCTCSLDSKKNSIAIFPPCVLMYQKREISLPVGYKTAQPETEDWE